MKGDALLINVIETQLRNRHDACSTRIDIIKPQRIMTHRTPRTDTRKDFNLMHVGATQYPDSLLAQDG